MLAYCLRRADREAAEEAVAEVFAVAWRRREEIPADQPPPWLLAVARRVLANERRAARRRLALRKRLARERAWTEGFSPFDEGDPAPVMEAFRRLSPTDQEVLRLVAWEDLRPQGAAQVLGCSPSMFRLRLYRARRRLQRVLAELEESRWTPLSLGERTVLRPEAKA